MPTTFAGGLALCAPVSPDRWDFAVSVAAAAEAISGITLGTNTMAADLGRMQQMFGTAEHYTDKGRQLASADARQLLRETLTGPIRFTPVVRAYQFAGELPVGALMGGTVGLPTNLVPVQGYDKGCSADNVEFVGVAA